MSAEVVTVLLFARYRDVLGASSIRVPRQEAMTVATIVSYLRALPGGDLIPPQPFVAVNMRQVGLEHQVGADDEVALLPPMAGG